MKGNRPPLHWRNLTRGLLCPHDTPDVRYLRLQSTWCEQKRWGDILMALDADLYWHLARGDECVVHDVSERARETRACWQGLSWVRAACSLAWYGEAPVEVSRSGMDVTKYWVEMWAGLDGRAVAYVSYFEAFAVAGLVRLRSCYVRECQVSDVGVSVPALR